MCDASAVAVSGVATAAKTNVALVSAVGFFFFHHFYSPAF